MRGLALEYQDRRRFIELLKLSYGRCPFPNSPARRPRFGPENRCPGWKYDRQAAETRKWAGILSGHRSWRSQSRGNAFLESGRCFERPGMRNLGERWVVGIPRRMLIIHVIIKSQQVLRTVMQMVRLHLNEGRDSSALMSVLIPEPLLPLFLKKLSSDEN